MEAAVTENGGSVIAWRQVPVDRDSIGKNAQRTCPLIRQLFIDGSGFADQAEFERKLFVMRREMERRVEGCYVCSCSSRSIVYKGLFLGTQIEGFYGDLASEHFKSPWPLSTSATARTPSPRGAWPIPSATWPTTGKSTPCAET